MDSSKALLMLIRYAWERNEFDMGNGNNPDSLKYIKYFRR